MKKIYTILLSMVTVSAFSQAVPVDDKQDRFMDHVQKVMSQPESQIAPEVLERFRAEKARNQFSAKAGAIDGIIDFPLAIDDWYQSSTLTQGFFEMFPDSNVVVEYTSSFASPFNHSIGGVYDPVMENDFAKDWTFSVSDTVYVDTIYIDGLYFRNQSTDDSLVLEVTVGERSGGAFAGVIFNPGQFPNLAPDEEATLTTIDYAGNGSDGNHIGMTGITNYFSTALTVDDTVLKTYAFPVNLTLLPGQIMGYLFTFKPEDGTWNAGDTISLPGNTGPNYFRPLIWYNADNADQSAYFLDFWDDGDINCGNFLYSDTRYAAWTGSDAWRNDQSTAQARINSSTYYYVRGNSSSTVGIEEASNKLNVVQNFPNPFNQVSTIQYEVIDNANVAVEIYDITGKTVMTFNEGRRNAGVYTIQLNAEDFDNGVYYYSLIADGSRVTKKMMVLK